MTLGLKSMMSLQLRPVGSKYCQLCGPWQGYQVSTVAARATGFLSSAYRSSDWRLLQAVVAAELVVYTRLAEGVSCRSLCSGKGQLQTYLYLLGPVAGTLVVWRPWLLVPTMLLLVYPTVLLGLAPGAMHCSRVRWLGWWHAGTQLQELTKKDHSDAASDRRQGLMWAHNSGVSHGCIVFPGHAHTVKAGDRCQNSNMQVHN